MTEIIKYFADESNYKKSKGRTIKYIVYHYTGNINDSALSNCRYFKNKNIGSSAHFFVDDKSIYCSVDPENIAWSVGLGNRKEPYKNMPMFGVITNSNSISIEMCGGKTSYEAPEETIKNAIELGSFLMGVYGLTTNDVFRHYDVTGKQCPAWLIADDKWNKFKERFEEMNYEKFMYYMNMFFNDKSKMSASEWARKYFEYIKELGIMNGTEPKSFVTREELAVVIWRLINKINED
ncbi:MAG: N-acetylmuramoyl-L-alanine amidase [Podoviridae sp. ctbd591]|nr:MAG: N-acetylmuramoyl-L-alanine amidase [Podoviridae sp. ctbd591]